MENKLKKISILVVVFLGVSIILSKTIYSYNLAKVKVAKVEMGTLKTEEKLEGYGKYKEKSTHYNEFEGKVADLFVAKNDIVKKGDLLYALSFDTEKMKETMEDNRLRLKDIDLDISHTKTEIEKIKAAISVLKDKKFSSGNPSKSDIEATERELEKLIVQAGKKKLLYENDVITQKEYGDVLDEIEIQEARLKDLIDMYEKEVLKKVDEKEDQAIEREKEIESLGEKIEENNYQLQAKIIQKEQIYTENKRLEKTLQTCHENQKVYAKENGKIKNLQIENGKFVMPHEKVLEIVKLDSLILEIETDKKLNFLAVGDSVIVHNGKERVEAIIEDIEQKEEKKILKIPLYTAGFSDSEFLTVEITHQEAGNHLLVPNASIGKDKDSYFIYTIDERDGLLGKEYFVKKTSVVVGNTNGVKTIIKEGLGFLDTVIVDFSKEIKDNQTVEIANEGDLYDQ